MWGSATAHRVAGNTVAMYAKLRPWRADRDAHFRKHLGHLQHGSEVTVFRVEDLDGSIKHLLSRVDRNGERYMLLKDKGNLMWRHFDNGKLGDPLVPGREFMHFFAGTQTGVVETLPLYENGPKFHWISSHNDFALLHPGEGAPVTISQVPVRPGMMIYDVAQATTLTVTATDPFEYVVRQPGDVPPITDSRLFWPSKVQGLPRFFVFKLFKAMRVCFGTQ